ncbi:MAG TPA: DUF5985 family protein [Sandaracinaceae bacterium]
MAEAVYLLCAIASVICAALLFRSYTRTRLRLSLYTMLCFLAFAVNNILLFIDLAVVPTGPDLSAIRNSIALGGVLVLLYAMITESA